MSPSRALILAGRAVVCVVAYRVFPRIGRLPQTERVLR